MSDILDCILKRRSIRQYTDEPVDPADITCLLQAAMAAPSAADRKPWEFVVVTDAEVLERLRGRLVFGRYNAPVAIAVCGNMERAFPGIGRDLWIQDCSAAVENMLLAAVGLGLGTVWIGVHPTPPVMRAVSEVLALPQHVIPLCVVYVGHPAEVKEPRTQYDEKRVFWQQYEPRKIRAKDKGSTPKH